MAKIFQRPVDHRTGVGWTQVIFGLHGWRRKLETQRILELSRWKPGTDCYPPQPGGRKRHADDGTLRRMYADIPKSTNSVPWDGPHKRILFESEDPESTLSGSETRETRPGWPPDDMCADSTRYKGSFDDRDREGLRLLSPLFQKKVLKLQRDLEEAKAESR